MLQLHHLKNYQNTDFVQAAKESRRKSPPCPADGFKGFRNFFKDKSGIEKYREIIEASQRRYGGRQTQSLSKSTKLRTDNIQYGSSIITTPRGNSFVIRSRIDSKNTTL